MNARIFQLLIFLSIVLCGITNGYGQAAPQHVTPLQDGDNVLFIGNSYTEWNGPLHNVINSLLKANGSGINVSFTFKGKGMGILKEYATWSSLGIIDEIRKGGWKYVVIQGWNDAIEFKDSGVNEDGSTGLDPRGYPACQDTMLKYLKVLDSEIKKVGATTILYEPHAATWSWMFDFPKSAATYAKLKNEVSCFHAPIITAWDSMRIKYPPVAYECHGPNTTGSFIEKLYADCGHQNASGMLLDAMTFYTIFTQKSAATLKPALPMAFNNPALYEELASLGYNTGKYILALNNCGFTDTQAPTIPSTLKASNIITDSYNLSWTPSIDNIGVLGYNIYKDNILVGTTSTPKFAIGGLVQNTTYAMKIKAFDSERNTTDFSATLNVTTATASNVNTSGVLLDWDFTAQQGSTSVVATNVVNGISASAPSAVANIGPVLLAQAWMANWFLMRGGSALALTEAIATNQYMTFSIAPQTGCEVAIDSIVAKLYSQNSLRTFTLMSSTKGFTAGAEIGSVTTSYSLTNNFVVTGHNNTTSPIEFRIYVWGYNNGWESFGLNDLTVHGSVKSSTLLSFPTQLKATNLTETGFTLGWQAAKDAASYNVFQNGALVGNKSDLTMNITGVVINSTYTMTVEAVTAAGAKSEMSNSLDVNIPDLHNPSIPSNIHSSGITNNSFILNWNAASDNVGVTLYEIFMDGALYGNTASTYLPVPYLVANKLYKMSVRSKDFAGNISAQSGSIDVTTLGVSSSIKEVSESTVSLFPNPASNFITITFQESAGALYLHIMDLQGREISAMSNIESGKPVSVGFLNEGLYILKLEQTNGSEFKKLLIQRK